MIIKIFKSKKAEYILLLLTAVTVFLIGFIAQQFTHKSGEMDEISTVFMMVMTISAGLFMSISNSNQTFNMTVGMGRTRKNYLFGNIVTILLKNIVIISVSYILHIIETKIIYSDLKQSVNMDMFFKIKICLIIVIFLSAIELFISAMYLKYDKKAFWVFWSIYMLCCFMPEKIHTAMKNTKNSIFAKIGEFIVKILKNTTANQMIAFGVVISVFFAFISAIVILNQDVKA